MILCFKDLDSLQKYIETMFAIHKLSFEIEILNKVQTMFKKKQNIVKQNQSEEEVPQN